MIKTILPVSVIIALRFLGLFIVLPVLSIYALSLGGANEMLVGAAVGIYAISQMLFQIPFGALSDKIGRKITLFIGTAVFIAGSLICFYADSIYWLLFGRLVQGMGAVGAVGTALISDFTTEDKRGKAMAFMGAVIALSFAFSMTLGPLIGGIFGIDKLFLLTAVLGILSLLLLWYIPTPPKIKTAKTNAKVSYIGLLRDENLLRMNITAFLQKMLMTLAFMSIPIILTHKFDLEKSQLWLVYAPAMLCGLAAMAPSVIFGEKRKKSREMLGVGIALFALSYFIMGYAKNELVFVAGVVIFFIGFNIHEPLMQSMASKYAKAKERGATLGVFNVFGYMGTFLGGIAGGLALKSDSLQSAAWIVAFVCVIWLVLIATLKNPSFFHSLYLSDIEPQNAQKLDNLNGIIEWYFAQDNLIVKYNSALISKEKITEILSR